jgi:hypothetical protein
VPTTASRISVSECHRQCDKSRDVGRLDTASFFQRHVRLPGACLVFCCVVWSAGGRRDDRRRFATYRTSLLSYLRYSEACVGVGMLCIASLPSCLMTSWSSSSTSECSTGFGTACVVVPVMYDRSGWVRLGWVGSDWVRMGLVGSDWVRLGRVGLG